MLRRSSAAAATPITLGARFRAAVATIGSAAVGAWEVVEVYRGKDDIDYARLANIADPSKVKSVACNALLTYRQYRRIGSAVFDRIPRGEKAIVGFLVLMVAIALVVAVLS